METWRPIVAIAAGSMGFLLSFIMLSSWGAYYSFSIVDSLFPAVSGVTDNINTNDYGPIKSLVAVVALSLCVGGAVGALLWERQVSDKKEMVLATIGFIVVMIISGANFWVDDQLINRSAQVLLDVVLIICGLTTLLILRQWRPSRPFHQVVRLVGAACISIYGVLLPAFFGTMFMLDGMGVDISGVKDYATLIQTLGTVSGAVAGYFVVKPKAQPELP